MNKFKALLLSLLAGVALTLLVQGLAHADRNAVSQAVIYRTVVVGGTDILPADITPSLTASAFRLTITLEGAPSVVDVKITDGASPFTTSLNSGNALAVGQLHTFVLGAPDTLDFNLQCQSGTTVTLILDEILDGAL